MHARLRTRTPVAAGALGIAVLMLSVGADLAVPTGTTAEAADCTEHTLFVAGTSPAPTGDRSFQSAIEDRNPGLSCLVTIDDDVVTVADAEAVDVVVISSSVKPSTLGDRLRDAAVPILVAEPFLFDDMSMAPARGGGELAGRTSINIVDSDNPLAGGLSGRVRVFDTASEVSYGTLDSGSLLEHQVANTGSTSRRSTIFAYETGDQLVDTGDVARAGRVGFFTSFGAELTDDARTLTSARSIGSSTRGPVRAWTAQAKRRPGCSSWLGARTRRRQTVRSSPSSRPPAFWSTSPTMTQT